MDRNGTNTRRRRLARIVGFVIGSTLPRIVRPESNRVCFASAPDFSDSAAAMYRHLMRTRSGLHFVWLVRDPRVGERIVEHFANSGDGSRHTLSVRRWRRPLSYLEYLRCGTVFHTHGVYSFSRRVPLRTVVSLWHGMPLKVIGALEDSGRWRNDVHGDLHVASSRLFRVVIAAAFRTNVESVAITGLPRTDVLKGHVPGPTRPDVASALGFDPERPWMLWLPTHRLDAPGSNDGSFVDDLDDRLVLDLLDACEARECQVIVKPHPLDPLSSGSVPELLRHRGCTVLGSDAWHRAGVDLYDALNVSDGLLTDVSSVLVDYLHARRPIGMVGFDAQDYGRDTVVPIDHLRECGSIWSLSDASAVAQFVDRVAARHQMDLPPSDVASWLNEDSDVFSCEALAQRARL